jgi:hypothetical protein
VARVPCGPRLQKKGKIGCTKWENNFLAVCNFCQNSEKFYLGVPTQANSPTSCCSGRTALASIATAIERWRR